MNYLKPNTLHVDNLSPRLLSLSSGQSSACSSGSVSPVPVIPIIAISRDGDESESESEIETEPARIFHRRMSTKRNNKLVSTPASLLLLALASSIDSADAVEHVNSKVSGAEVTCLPCKRILACMRVPCFTLLVCLFVCVLVRDEVSGGRPRFDFLFALAKGQHAVGGFKRLVNILMTRAQTEIPPQKQLNQLSQCIAG